MKEFSQFTDSTEKSKTGDQQIPVQSKEQTRRMNYKLLKAMSTKSS